MHDEQVMYRVQWPALYQHVHRLCLGQHKRTIVNITDVVPVPCVTAPPKWYNSYARC